MNNHFIESINEVYPDFNIKDWHLNEIGQNNDVVIINHKFVFRFPKYENGIIQLKKETDILAYIKKLVTLPIPEPIYQSLDKVVPGKAFIGYELIDGAPFWRQNAENIKCGEKIERLSAQLSTFLLELHSISIENANKTLRLEENNPKEEMSKLYQKIQAKLFPFIRRDAQFDISQSFTNFLNSKALQNVKPSLIHGDFGQSNILWDPEKCRISGIIDFGGSGVEDPAYDFAGILSSYGEEFFEKCIGLYPNGSEIAERVRFYRSTFALQEALHGVENNDKQAFENGIKEYI